MSGADWLFELPPGRIRWGTERIEALLAGVGNPHRRFRAVHVAGTNGKGSVCALCDAVLRAQGDLRIGLYTSPHLVHFNERIRIDGRPVDDATISAAAERLRAAIERHEASFFEAATAIAFLCFAEAGVEIAVVEVGMGGRLDATRTVDAVVTGITNVALDHTEHLGSTLAEIAAEKAGICRPGVPLLSGATEPEAREVIRARAAAVGAPLVELDAAASVDGVRGDAAGTEFRLRSRNWGETELRVALPGEHQAANAAFAAELLGLLPEELRPSRDALREGFAAARWPGRLQVERISGTTWIFDVAHNLAGAEALAAALGTLSPPRPLVLFLAVLADKPWQQMATALLPHCDAVIVTEAPSAPPERRWKLAEVETALRQSAVPVRSIPDFAAALGRAATLAPCGTVVVSGSVYTVGDALAELGVAAE